MNNKFIREKEYGLNNDHEGGMIAISIGGTVSRSEEWELTLASPRRRAHAPAHASALDRVLRRGQIPVVVLSEVSKN